MTRLIAPNVLLIEEQPPETCDLCGAVEECRPYGPNGENVCFSCGTGTPEAEAAAQAAFAALLNGEG